jgi:uroporphyrinogen-III synthase
LNVRLLLTRPQSDAQRTAATLAARGHQAIIAPLLRIEPVTDAPIGPGPWGAILVTSANAATAVAAHTHIAKLRGVRVLAVGERSAQAMRAAGFPDVTAADGGVAALARLVTERVDRRASLLYLAGEERAGDLAGDLRAEDFIVQTAVVYRAVAESELPRAAADALAAGIDGVLHFSRRSAEAYVHAAQQAGLLSGALRATHFCLSAQVAAPLLQAGAAMTRIAAAPTESALIALLDQKPA